MIGAPRPRTGIQGGWHRAARQEGRNPRGGKSTGAECRVGRQAGRQAGGHRVKWRSEVGEKRARQTYPLGLQAQAGGGTGGEPLVPLTGARLGGGFHKAAL